MSQNLFSSMFSGSTSASWYTDWYSIKSGSYQKLMRSYYGGSDYGSTGVSSSGSNSSGKVNIIDQLMAERRNPTVSKEVQEANAGLTTGISKLRSSLSVLQNKNTYLDSKDKTDARDKTVSAIKDYVSQYNNVVNTAKKSTLLRKTENVAGMMRSSKANVDRLAEIGISINENGTLQLDEEKLKSTDLSKIQDVFSKDNVLSYGSTVNARLSFADAAPGATESTEETTEDAKETVGNAASLKTDIETMMSADLFKKIQDKDGARYDIDKIFSAAKNFVNDYNALLNQTRFSANSGVMSNTAQIMNKTAQQKGALAEFGISLDTNGRLSINEDTFKASDMEQMQKFFKTYGASIASNVSLVNYYMTTQADASNGYTATGAYDAQGALRFNTAI